jgi:GMP synthase-like glutamine amidotransferase
MTNKPRPPRVAIIDNSIFPDIYKPVQHWGAALPAAWEAFPARDHRFPDLGRFTHLLLTGSEASILEPDAWVAEEAEIVREAARRGLAVLGSCWGHQLLAFALAGSESVARCPRPEIGWIRLHIDKQSNLLGPAGEAPWTFSLHFDEVLAPDGSPFEVLASSDLCRVQAMRLKGGPVWGLQCHPEIDVAAARKFLRDLADRGFKGKASLLEALGSPARDSGLIRRIASAFLGLAAPGRGGYFA